MAASTSPPPPPSGTTPLDVAKWMLAEVTAKKSLYQDTAVYDIKRKFGKAFTYTNDNGNLAIGKDVLKEFAKQSSATVVWDRSERKWRLRTSKDDPKKRQVED